MSIGQHPSASGDGADESGYLTAGPNRVRSPWRWAVLGPLAVGILSLLIALGDLRARGHAACELPVAHRVFSFIPLGVYCHYEDRPEYDDTIIFHEFFTPAAVVAVLALVVAAIVFLIRLLLKTYSHQGDAK